MKVFVFLFGAAAAGFLGYIMEPTYRQKITGIAVTENTTSAVEIPQIAEDPISSIDFSSLQPSQLPSTVVLKAPLKVNDSQTGASKTLEAGSPLKSLRVENDKIIVRLGDDGPAFPVAISQTDLAEQLAANPAPPVPAPSSAAAPSSSPFGVPNSPTNPITTPENESTSATPAPAETIVPPAISPVNQDAQSSDVIAAMKEDIRNGAIKEFNYASVTDWQQGTNETIDGTEYQTGTATYKSETIFGSRNYPAKAFIKDGKVVRWISPASGLQIR